MKIEMKIEMEKERTNNMATCGGCEYCKEDSEGYRKMLGAFFISYSSFDDKWFINTGHCKPRQIYFCPMCGRELKRADMRKEDNPDLLKGGVDNAK